MQRIGRRLSENISNGLPTQAIREFLIKQTYACYAGRPDEITIYVKPANPWENVYVESFNARMRDELLDGEIFVSLAETKYVVNR